MTRFNMHQNFSLGAGWVDPEDIYVYIPYFQEDNARVIYTSKGQNS
jgi:hypothetical protein